MSLLTRFYSDSMEFKEETNHSSVQHWSIVYLSHFGAVWSSAAKTSPWRFKGEVSWAKHHPLRQQVNSVHHSEPTLHDLTKHIDKHYHFIRDLVRDWTTEVTHYITNEQVEDIFTKALPNHKHEYFRDRNSKQEVHIKGDRDYSKSSKQSMDDYLHNVDYCVCCMAGFNVKFSIKKKYIN